MKRQHFILPLACVAVLAGCSARSNTDDATLQQIPFQQVTLEDNFWLPRLKTQKEVLVPFALDKVRPAMDNLRKTGNWLHGVKDELPFPHRYVASDLYKVMEGAAYLLTLERDAALEHHRPHRARPAGRRLSV